MKNIILSLALLFSLQAQAGTTERILGAWKLNRFMIFSREGTEQAFCNEATGFLIYTESRHVSVSINCGSNNDGSYPADVYGGKLFYAGTFKVDGDVVSHHILNSSYPGFLGKTLVREATTLDDGRLLLTGALGDSGDTLEIEWEQAQAAPVGSSAYDAIANARCYAYGICW